MNARPRAYVEPPAGWGQRQRLAVALEQLGYRVDVTGAGDRWILVLG